MDLVFLLPLAFAPVQEGAPTLAPEVSAYVVAVRTAADRIAKGDFAAAERALDGAALAQRGFEWDHLHLALELARERALQPLLRDDPSRGARGSRGPDAAPITDAPVGAVSTLRGHAEDARAAAVSSDGMRVATCGVANDVRLWNARTGDVAATLSGHVGPVVDLAFAPDGKRLASASRDGTVRLWESFDGTPALVLVAAGTPLARLAWSPTGAELATADEARVIRVWPADRTEARRALHGHAAAVTALVFSDDGARLASGGADGELRAWDVATGETRFVLHLAAVRRPGEPEAPAPAVTALLAEPGRDTFLVATTDGYLRRHAWSDGAVVTQLRTYPNVASALTATRDGRRFVLGTRTGLVQVWHPVGVPLFSTTFGTEEVRALGFDGAGSRLVAATADRVVHVLETDAETARTLQRAAADALPDAETAAELKPLAIDALCRRVVHRPGLAFERYEEAETLLASACERMPESGQLQTTLGAARYRQERYADALATLDEAGAKRRGLPANLAYRAMALARLGRRDEAAAQLARLDTLMREERWIRDVESTVLHDEARAVVGAALDARR